ncbi:Pilin glycosylation enzyme [Pseudomonas cichorii]|uniref:Pilin glycosylation enzyme n=1 Tax=Pseudomonas cichorii TaxID=36746 RepID=A0A3M4LQH9_PSECI|nr:O-antigen ligase family protein [Pseudomonas cichorii]RMQ43726.1 Pilin glycosylation enzyme [Pseudomonas cichorii]
MLSTAKNHAFFFFCSAILFICAGTFELSGHDFQRLAQFVIGVLSVLTLYWYSVKGLNTSVFKLGIKAAFLCILMGGILSSLAAHQPLWAFTELSVLLLCSAIASAFAQQRLIHGVQLDRLFIGFVVFICTIKTLQFLSATVAAFLTSTSTLDTDLLLEGFSNKRFYGQFQTFTLPLLALPLLLVPARRSIKAAIFILLSLWWMIAITGGTRGTWLGMAAAVIVAFCLGRAGRNWAGWQLAAASAGLLLFLLLFSLLPAWLGIEISNFAGERLNTSLSARERLWQQAWTMIQERPLLGFGPMHFADIWNPVGAHPHQAILQWASEWGVPSTLCVAGMAGYGLVVTGLLLRKKAHSQEPVDLMRLCLFASLVGALTQAMVDGVIVMPYSQLWLAIIVGWLLALHERQIPAVSSNCVLDRMWLACLLLAAGLILYTILRDFPHLEDLRQQSGQSFGGPFLPRFWLQGIIAHPPE